MITVEIWSDVVCPWCYIGKRRLERALAEFEPVVEIVWRSYQLDPETPVGEQRGMVESFAARKGLGESQVRSMFAQVTDVAAGEGLEYDFDRVRPANTLDAHRLLHFAAAHGRQGELKERLLRAYFTEGEQIDHPEVLARLAGEVGLDEAAARRALDDGAHADDVLADFETARSFGISGVPFFVFNRRFAVSGAQPTEVFTRALEAAREASAVDAPHAEGHVCEDDNCAV
ncbi:DsbA family oxidoreductase [Planosporangium flavigriseum]|uniref:DSBA oxidoreductase n=1 Tax=Planosporangium flavigriseum TaxID=373681 RepID=A0A8J3LK24_9ACTN|nr:DsbA family oxidoreductase [Planosporangium flavigriseum]NJC64692.1 DsbA family oxidoreductase [Planosporangium flavigriseum]GIG74082.1 DSBA oxidoreductase [Planosporangium flavigriseum]